MSTEKLRSEWNKSAAEIDANIKHLVDQISGVPGTDPAVMAFDLIYRNYLRWADSAKELGVKPDVVYKVAAHIISTMVLELSTRVRIHVEGEVMPPIDWAHDFMTEVWEGLKHDIVMLQAKAAQLKQ